VLSSFTPLHIPDLHWVLLAEIDELEAFRSVYRLREQLILSGLILMLFAVILGFIISGTMTRPIHALTRVSEQFGRGDFRRRAKVGSEDEIGRLGATFNTMAEKITSHTQRLEDEIRERRRAEEGLQRSRQQFRNLSRHLQGAREEERKSIAREIHDDLGQRLTLHKLQLTLLEQDLSTVDTALGARCTVMAGEIDATIQSVKRIISQLRPGVLDDLGLTAAIEWQTEEFQRHTGIACVSRITPPDITLDPERSTALFRIFQETLTNVARHAGADRVHITLSADADGITMEISDNGCGISAAAIERPASFGLMGMRERASYFGGSIRLYGTPGEGTRVMVHFPHTTVDMPS
jgi:signal transduction histidine kinase